MRIRYPNSQPTTKIHIWLLDEMMIRTAPTLMSLKFTPICYLQAIYWSWLTLQEAERDVTKIIHKDKKIA